VERGSSGVYLGHTGPPSDEERRMAAVLYAWPAALAGESALIAHGARNIRATSIRVAVETHRRIAPPAGVQIQRIRGLEERVLWNRTPARLRLEDAALETASRRCAQSGEAAAIAVLADICQQRLSTAQRLRKALDSYPRLAGRAFLLEVLDDVATGAFSVLEHRYLTTVERAHGLPLGTRQVEFDHEDRKGFRDVLYLAHRLLVELDGRVGHEFAADQWADLERDLASAGEEMLTIRLGWGPVSRPCRPAPVVGRVLQTRGWRGQVTRCRDCQRDVGVSGETG
jgi:hypothetical protein